MDQNTPKRYFSTPINASLPPFDISASTMAPNNEPDFNSLETSRPSAYEKRTAIYSDDLDAECPLNLARIENGNSIRSKAELVNKSFEKKAKVSSSPFLALIQHVKSPAQKNMGCFQFQKVRSETSSSNQF